MSINKYGFSQEDVCIWFKSNLEGHSRIDLMCSLLDICLPLELRFLGTYLEYAAGKHHAHLQKWEKDANNPNSFSVTDLSDATTRRRLCLFLTLLHSHNKSIATKLFDVLSLYESLALIQIPSSNNNQSHEQEEKVKESDTVSSPEVDATSWNELKLLLTMSSLHPAFSFDQRQIIREKLDQFIALTSVSTLLSSDRNCEGNQVDVKKNQASGESSNELLQTAPGSENTVLIVSEPSTGNPLSVASNSAKGLLPTPLLQQLHYPQYHAIPVQTNFSVHAAQPIIIPTTLTVLNQEQLLCSHSNCDLPPNLNTSVQYSQNVSFHKANNPVSSKTNPDIHTSHAKQEVLQNIQFTSFHPPTLASSSKRLSDMNGRDNMNKQPFFMQNHITPYQVLNNNFLVKSQEFNHNKQSQSADVHTSWANGVILEKSHDINSQHEMKMDRNLSRSESRTASDVDLSSRRSISDTNLYDASCVKVPVISRPVLTDTTLVNPNAITRNLNGEFTMSYKSKVIRSPYVHLSEPTIYSNNQPRAGVKNMSDLNIVRNHHANLVTSPLIVPHVNMPKMNSFNDRTMVQSSLSTAVTNVVTMSHAVVSSISNIHSPQVYVFADRETSPAGINGGYIAKSVNQDTYHGNTVATLSDTLQRPIGNHNLLSAEKNDTSPISVQVHRKISQSTTTNSNHILSPAGGKYSGDYIESPGTSPGHSPKRSPYSSPSNSPMLHRKDHSNSKEQIDPYSSASSWLKSLRLHKYSHKFEGYTFQMMKDLDEETLAELIVTKGAQSKFKQNIEQLIKRGFKEFGCGENPFHNDDDVDSTRKLNTTSPSEGSSVNKVKTVEVTSVLSEYILSPHLNSHTDSGRHPYQTIHAYHAKELSDVASKGKSNGNRLTQRSNSYEDMNGRWMGEVHPDDDSYDEVLTSRKTSVLATCYNCGARGHYGHQCIEETMEAQTYSRYAFQLDFSRRDSFKNTEPAAGGATISSR